jgi:uncharacterized protein YkwD
MRTGACILTLCVLALAGRADEKKQPAKLELSEDEKLLLELTNKERARENLPPLKVNALLCQAARGHSANMVRKGVMDHVLDGKKPMQRAKDAGYVPSVIAENIYWGAEKEKVADAVKWWMKSPAHKVNILHKEFTEIGLGIVRADKDKLVLTQLFGAPLD